MLFYTQLQTLPDEFCTLLNLKSLHLGSNEVLDRGAFNFADHGDGDDGDYFLRQIARLPDAFGDLTSLEALCLSDNELEALPSSIGRIPDRSGQSESRRARRPDQNCAMRTSEASWSLFPHASSTNERRVPPCPASSY